MVARPTLGNGPHTACTWHGRRKLIFTGEVAMGLRVNWSDAGLTEQSFLEDVLGLQEQSLAGEDAEVTVYSGIEREPSTVLTEAANTRTETWRVLVHVSDEKLRHRNFLYSKFDVVLRNYFDPRIAWRRNVFFIPLGWTAAFAPNERVLSDSPSHSWSFAGAIKADRGPMVDAFRVVDGGAHHFSSGWDSSDQIPPEKLREIYEDSVFVLCPQGNAHVDTFRVMEALQAGAIPVTTAFLGRDFFRYTFGDHPFVVAKTWEEAAHRVKKLMANGDETRAYRARVQDWYGGYVEGLRRLVAGAISGEPPLEELRTRNRHVLASRFDVVLNVSVAARFWRYRKRRK